MPAVSFLGKFIEQHSSGGADSCSANEEISCLL
jgi:hypothetical protein